MLRSWTLFNLECCMLYVVCGCGCGWVLLHSSVLLSNSPFVVYGAPLHTHAHACIRQDIHAHYNTHTPMFINCHVSFKCTPLRVQSYVCLYVHTQEKKIEKLLGTFRNQPQPRATREPEALRLERALRQIQHMVRQSVPVLCCTCLRIH